MTVYLILLIMAIAAVYFGVRLFTMKSTLKKANAELREILENIEENRIVKLSDPNRDVEKLLVTVNALLAQIRQKAIEYKLGEKRLKKEVESISHDLRTPLTSLLGYLKLIDAEGLNPEDKASLETARQKAYTLQRLISQFYDLSRIDAGSYELKPEDVDISRLLREHITAQYALLSEMNLDVSITIPDEPVVIRADINALERIILNLLHNAGKYAKSMFRVSLMEEEHKALVTFENDFAETYTGQYGGDMENTGLGLTIARHLTEKMGAMLNVETETNDISQWFRIKLIFGTSMENSNK